tara:strand:+ start:6309 stop:6467 length:159 start_codon:yes stop_codon:yes gene_type:complete
MSNIYGGAMYGKKPKAKKHSKKQKKAYSGVKPRKGGQKKPKASFSGYSYREI